MFNYKRLKQLRDEVKLSQEDMGLSLNMTQPTYCKYENGETKLNFDILYLIQEKYDIDPSEFIAMKNNVVNFENGSTNNGNGILQAENYYEIPKDMYDTFVSTMQSLVEQLQNIKK